jgi:hypothetical protein
MKKYYQRHKQGMQFLYTLLVTGSLCACVNERMLQTYEGAPLDPKQHAVISTSKKNVISIIRVDGKMTADLGAAVFTGYPTSVAVLPGKHELQIKYDMGPPFTYKDICFDAQAGETYVVKALPRASYVEIWMINAHGLDVKEENNCYGIQYK